MKYLKGKYDAAKMLDDERKAERDRLDVFDKRKAKFTKEVFFPRLSEILHYALTVTQEDPARFTSVFEDNLFQFTKKERSYEYHFRSDPLRVGKYNTMVFHFFAQDTTQPSNGVPKFSGTVEYCDRNGKRLSNGITVFNTPKFDTVANELLKNFVKVVAFLIENEGR